MKKSLKLLMIFVIALALTGCVKVRCQINITDRDDADIIMAVLFDKEILDTYQMSQDNIKSQLQEEGNFKNWEIKDASETIDGKKYLGFNATAPKEVSEKILEDLTVEENQYTLKLKGSDLDKTINTNEFEQLGYSTDKLEEMGVEFSIKISMPGKIKSSTLGEVKDGVVTIGLKDYEKLSDGVEIVSETSEPSSNTGLIVGVIAIVIVGEGAFYFYKRKSKSNKDNLE